MTEKEFMEKYGDEKVKFSHYYKYNFSFRGIDNPALSIRCGGDHDDIYRFDVDADVAYTVRELDPQYGRCGEDKFDSEW
jgi:hypothetical protein